MMATQRLFKFLCDGKEFFLLSTSSERQGSGITLVLCDTISAWEGRVTAKDMSLWSEKTNMSQPDYEALTQTALTGIVSAKTRFEYEVKTTDSLPGMELTWKKLVADGDIKFQLGSVLLKLSSTPSKVIGSIFNYAIKSIGSFEEKLAALGSERDRLTEDREITLKRLAECATVKEDTERELYTKFVDVLNAKKDKLRELKPQLTGVHNSRSDPQVDKLSSGERHSVATTSRHNKDTKASSSSSRQLHSLGSDEDNDDEKKPSSSASTKNRQNVTKGKAADLNHDNLILDDGSNEDDEELMSLSIKRPRTDRRKVIQQPTKPVIPPCVSSQEVQQQTIDKNSSQQSTRESVTKVTSKSSNRSSNVDTDNLLDDLA